MRNNLRANFFIEDNIPQFEGRMKSALANVRQAFEETGRSGNMASLNRSLGEAHSLLQQLEGDLREIANATDFSNRSQSKAYADLIKKVNALRVEINGVETAQRRMAGQAKQVGQTIADALGKGTQSMEQQAKNLEARMRRLSNAFKLDLKQNVSIDPTEMRQLEQYAQNRARVLRGLLTRVEKGSLTKTPEQIAQMKRDLEHFVRLQSDAAHRAAEAQINEIQRVEREQKASLQRQERAARESANRMNATYVANQQRSYQNLSQRIDLARGGGQRFRNLEEVQQARNQLVTLRRYMPKDSASAQMLGFDDPVTAQLRMKQQAKFLKEQEQMFQKWNQMSRMQRIGAYLAGSRPGGTPRPLNFNLGQAFHGMNHKITNVAQLMGTSLYGLGAFGATTAFVKGTVGAAMEAEQTKTVLAGLINTYQRFKDVTGEALSPQENFNRALEKSGELYDKLRKVAEKSILTTRETTQYYMGAAAFGFRQKLSEDQVLRVTERLGTLGKSMGLADRDISQDIRALLQSGGRLGSEAKIAQVLGISGKERDQMLAAGPDKFMKWFEEKFKGLNPALDRYANSFANKLAAFQEKLQSAGRLIGEVLIDHLGPMLDSLKSTVNDWIASGRAEKFAQNLGNMLSAIGGLFVKFVDFLGSTVQSPLDAALVALGLILTRFVAGIAAQQMAAHSASMGFVGVLAALVIGIELWTRRLKNEAASFQEKGTEFLESRNRTDQEHVDRQRSAAGEVVRREVKDAVSLHNGAGPIDNKLTVSTLRDIQGGVQQFAEWVNKTRAKHGLQPVSKDQVMKAIYGMNLGNPTKVNMSEIANIATIAQQQSVLDALGIGNQLDPSGFGDIKWGGKEDIVARNQRYADASKLLTPIRELQGVLHENKTAVEATINQELKRGGKWEAISRKQVHDEAIKEAKTLDPKFQPRSFEEAARIVAKGNRGDKLTPEQTQWFLTYNRAVARVMKRTSEGTVIDMPATDTGKPKKEPGYSLGREYVDNSQWERALAHAQNSLDNSQHWYAKTPEMSQAELLFKMGKAKKVYENELAVIAKQFELDKRQIRTDSVYLGGMRLSDLNNPVAQKALRAATTGAGSRIKFQSDNAADRAKMNPVLMQNLEVIAEQLGFTLGVSAAKSDHRKMTTSGNVSRHGAFNALDLAVINGVSYASNPNKFTELANKLTAALESAGYSRSEAGNAKAVLFGFNDPKRGGNHLNHLHVSNTIREAGYIAAGGKQATVTDKLADTYAGHIVEARNKLEELIRRKDKAALDAKQRLEKEITRLGVEYNSFDISAQALAQALGFNADEHAFAMKSMGLGPMEWDARRRLLSANKAHRDKQIESDFEMALLDDKAVLERFTEIGPDGKPRLKREEFDAFKEQMKHLPDKRSIERIQKLQASGFEYERQRFQLDDDFKSYKLGLQQDRDAKAHESAVRAAEREQDFYGRSLGMRGLVGSDLELAKIDERIFSLQEAIDLKRKNMAGLDPTGSMYAEQMAEYQREIKIAQEQIQSQKELADAVKRNTEVTHLLTVTEAARLQQRIDSGRYESNPFRVKLSSLDTEFEKTFGGLDAQGWANAATKLGIDPAGLKPDTLKIAVRNAWFKNRLPQIDAARARGAMYDGGSAALAALLTRDGDPVAAFAGSAGGFLGNRMQGHFDEFLKGRGGFRVDGKFNKAAQQAAMAEFGSTFLVNRFMNTEGSYSGEGSQIGGLIGALTPALGPFGSALGVLGGGLLGSIFGKRRSDPADEAYRKRIAELLSRIDKSLRPVGDYYRTRVRMFNADTAYLSGRSLGYGDMMGAN